MKKIKGLVFNDYSEVMDELFERVRTDLFLDREQFEAILKTEKGQELFKAFDDTVTKILGFLDTISLSCRQHSSPISSLH